MFMSPAQQMRTVPSLSIPGRQQEIGRLQSTWELCRNGRGSVVTLHGPVGAGRTELLDTFSEFADSDGAQVLMAAGAPLEPEFPLGIVRQLFQSPHLAPEAYAPIAPRWLRETEAVQVLRRAWIQQYHRGSRPIGVLNPTRPGTSPVSKTRWANWGEAPAPGPFCIDM
ncbi:AAA family ATPase [Streptomyces sp. NPDC001123]